jgi:hypothetical protein
MLEFLLNQAEMLALMTAVNSSLILGIDNERLIPDTQEEQARLAWQGIDSLKQRRLLRVEDETHIINGDLMMMAAAIAFPQVITFITRDVPGSGQQQFLHYRADPVNAELTMPTPEQYRLAALPDAIAALERIRQILPVTVKNDVVSAQQSLDQDTFFQVKTWAEQGKQRQAVETLQAAGFTAEAAERLVQTLYSPQLGGTVAFMQVVEQEVVNGRNLAMVQDKQTAWLIQQVVPGEPLMRIETVTAVTYSTALLETLTSLLQPEI